MKDSCVIKKEKDYTNKNKQLRQKRQVLSAGWSSFNSDGSSMNSFELQNRFNKSSLKFNVLQMSFFSCSSLVEVR